MLWHSRRPHLGSNGPSCESGSGAGFVKALFEKVHVEALVMGNLDQEEAQQLGKTVAKLLPSAPLPGSKRPGERIVQLPEGRSFLHRCYG